MLIYVKFIFVCDKEFWHFYQIFNLIKWILMKKWQKWNYRLLFDHMTFIGNLNLKNKDILK